jgi:hypothetical protein
MVRKPEPVYADEVKAAVLRMLVERFAGRSLSCEDATMGLGAGGFRDQADGAVRAARAPAQPLSRACTTSSCRSTSDEGSQAAPCCQCFAVRTGRRALACRTLSEIAITVTGMTQRGMHRVERSACCGAYSISDRALGRRRRRCRWSSVLSPLNHDCLFFTPAREPSSPCP